MSLPTAKAPPTASVRPTTSARPTTSVLIVPGYNGSGPDHWQTLWQAQRPAYRRVEQPCWEDPDPDAWCKALAKAVVAAPQPVIIVAHSLGCATVAHWTAHGRGVDRVAGALLVAPCDVDRPEMPACIARFAPMPSATLPFRSTVVASGNDSYATLDRARCFARDWGSDFVDAGMLGHINALSGLGSWPFGQELLGEMVAKICSPSLLQGGGRGEGGAIYDTRDCGNYDPQRPPRSR